MANYSYTQIKIQKNTKENNQIAIDSLESFYKEFSTFIDGSAYGNIGWIDATRLKKDNTPNESAKYSTAEILHQIKCDEYIEMELQGRWCSPSQLFIDLCKKYRLNLNYVDRENGCNFTHIVIIEDGKVKLNRQNEYISALSLKYCEEQIFDEIIEIFEDTEYYDNQDDMVKSLKDFLKDEEYFYIKKELRLSNKYKKLLEYAKDFYDRP